MLLPNRSQAYIPSAKLYEYLLSTTHSVGKGKAKFFRKFGFDESNARNLEEGLLLIPQTEDVLITISSPFGEKFLIDGSLNTPVGRSVFVRTIWIIEPGDEDPRFVTAYPRTEN